LTDNLFPGLDDALAESASESLKAYELKILKKLYAALLDDKELRHARVEAGEDFGLNYFNDEGLVPMVLFANNKVKVNPIHLIRSSGFLNTEMYLEYAAVAKRVDKMSAMFFPLIRVTQYVIHNNIGLPCPSGYNYVIRTGSSRGLDVRIESMESFLKALAEKYG